MWRVLAAAAIGLILAGPAVAGGKPLGPPDQRLTKAAVTKIFLQDEKVSDWLAHYPRSGRRRSPSPSRKSTQKPSQTGVLLISLPPNAPG